MLYYIILHYIILYRKLVMNQYISEVQINILIFNNMENKHGTYGHKTRSDWLTGRPKIYKVPDQKCKHWHCIDMQIP